MFYQSSEKITDLVKLKWQKDGKTEVSGQATFQCDGLEITIEMPDFQQAWSLLGFMKHVEKESDRITRIRAEDAISEYLRNGESFE